MVCIFTSHDNLERILSSMYSVQLVPLINTLLLVLWKEDDSGTALHLHMRDAAMKNDIARRHDADPLVNPLLTPSLRVDAFFPQQRLSPR